MTKLEKAMQIEAEKVKKQIVKSACPHNYGMEDRSTLDGYCDGNDCGECWNMEVEGDT